MVKWQSQGYCRDRHQYISWEKIIWFEVRPYMEPYSNTHIGSYAWPIYGHIWTICEPSHMVSHIWPYSCKPHMVSHIWPYSCKPHMVCSHMISMYMVWHTYGLNRPYVFKPYMVWHTYGFTGRHMVCAHMVYTHMEANAHNMHVVWQTTCIETICGLSDAWFSRI